MKKGSIIIAGLIFPLTVIFYLQTLQMPGSTSPSSPGPAYIPRVYLALAVILASAVIIKSLKEKSSQEVRWDKLGYVFVGFLIMASYVILLNIFGYFLATFLYVLGMAVFMDAKKKTGLFASLIFIVFTYSVFLKLFNLPLPKGILF